MKKLTVIAFMVVLIFGLTACNGNSTSQLESAQQKVDSASIIVRQVIDVLLSNALTATVELADHQELINAIASDDRDEVLRVANKLKQVAGLDFIIITDNNGIVLARTMDPLSYGDNVAHIPHVKNALNGNTMSSIEAGISIHLTTIACAPVYSDNMNLIGAVQLGYRLDEQELVLGMKELTGCEITIFRFDERIATTIMYEDGMFAIGTVVRDDVVEKVFAGETHTEKTHIFGNEAFVRYDPLFDAENQVIGMISVAEFIGN